MTTTLQKTTICPQCAEATSEIDEIICPVCGKTYHRACWDRCGCSTREEAVAAVRDAMPGNDAKKRWLLWLEFTIPLLIVIFAILIIQPYHATHDMLLTKWLLVAVIVAALTFDYVNGMNDAANAIATIIATRVLTPMMALLMAAALNFGGALVSDEVAKTITSGIVDPTSVTLVMVLCGLIGAVAWSWLMTRFGLPISLSHALIGGLIGAVLVAGLQLKWAKIISIFLWIFLAPIIGMVAGFLLMILLMWCFHRMAPHKLNKHFRFWQIISSSLMAFSHGTNDAQKAMGIITMALVAAGTITTGDHGAVVPLWVKLACAGVIALGTGIGGWGVIKTLGHKMIKLQPVHGFAAETAAAGTIQLASLVFHMPVSTTHVITASIMGVGASKRLSAVRWGVASNIMIAWIFTVPTCAGVAALLYYLVKILGLDPSM